MRSVIMLACCLALGQQGESPVGTYNLSFQPRAEVMTATLVIAKRDSGYKARITMRQLRRVVTSDSVSVLNGRVRVYIPSEVADLTFEFGLGRPDDDRFLVHLDDGDMRGPLSVERAKPRSP
jgi:hypothetical protein